MGFHLNRLNLERKRLLTANDPTATHRWTASPLERSEGTHAMGVYGLKLSTVIVDIPQMRRTVKRLKRVVCL